MMVKEQNAIRSGTLTSEKATIMSFIEWLCDDDGDDNTVVVCSSRKGVRPTVPWHM